MATTRANPRLQVGSAPWISDERFSSFQLAESEAEEFTFSARNEVDWLNEHMAEIFSENQVNVAEIFKTPGKLRGKTPRTARRANPLGVRAPLSDVFSATPRAGPSRFSPAHFEKPVPIFKVAEDEPQESGPEIQVTTSNVDHTITSKPAPNYAADSGYFGSQWNDATQGMEATQPNEPMEICASPKAPLPVSGAAPLAENDPAQNRYSDRRTTEASFQSAKEEQTRNQSEEAALKPDTPKPSPSPEETQPLIEPPLQKQPQKIASPQKQSPQRAAVVVESPPKAIQIEQTVSPNEEENIDEPHSPSEGSSPMRPIVRKSSLNFASLPAREPITTKKSIGKRVSHTNQLEQSRTSYYGRLTGGKSLGNIRQERDDEMALDEADQEDTDDGSNMLRLHNKTSTQRLQDQISMLGKSQGGAWPTSKSIPNTGIIHPPASQPNIAPPVNQAPQQKSPEHTSPQRRPFAAPGAFPEDEDESWIGAPTVEPSGPSAFSPRPQMTKSHSADVMEGIHETDSIGGQQFNISKRVDQGQMSPRRELPIPERTTSTLGHMKSASTSVLRSPKKAGELLEYQKLVSVSNPNPSTGLGDSTPRSKSPSRSQRGSPLKAAKDKFSSILKTSRGLFASSAAVSAEAKQFTMSPATSRMGLNSQPSFEEVLRNSHAYQSQDDRSKNQNSRILQSPEKASTRKSRDSIEREQKRIEDEARDAKEAQRMADQLEKARQKVQEEARIYHLEQERVAAMQKEVIARKEEEKEKMAKASQASVPRATRSSPRKTKAQLEAEGMAAANADALSTKDVEMTDVSTVPPTISQEVPRPKSQIGRPTSKRPLKPAKEPLTKAKPPTVIRVDTGSQRGHPYHPSTATLSATLQESLAAPTTGSHGLRNKASTSSIQSKSSTTSFKSAATKALEAAARKKEQDDLAAQRKREAKQELERQRAANKEEERRKEEQARYQEAERQRAVQQEQDEAASLANAKKSASRQAIEKRRLEVELAKKTRAPPPAIRPQQNGGDLSIAMVQEKSLPQQRGDVVAQAPRANSTVQRSHDDHTRPANSVLHNAAKVPPKRPLPQDAGDEHHARPTNQRNPPSYHNESHHAKRRRTSENFEDRGENKTEPQPKMTAPPIRQSSSRPKDMPTKSIFPSGYANAPPPNNLQRATLIAQHNQSKPAHPMDMAQISKAPIPFATTSGQGNAQHKTPARPGQAAPGTKGKSAAKSAAKSSPRYQNGDSIELPEINTDSEDDDSDAADEFVAMGWTNSPDLRKQLAKQETIDPAEVFGQPGPLNMEEVFSKSKDRFHKFRARTSSANWSGPDRLTEDEVRRDLEARDRVRRQGGWTYDSMV